MQWNGASNIHLAKLFSFIFVCRRSRYVVVWCRPHAFDFLSLQFISIYEFHCQMPECRAVDGNKGGNGKNWQAKAYTVKCVRDWTCKRSQRPMCNSCIFHFSNQYIRQFSHQYENDGEYFVGVILHRCCPIPFRSIHWLFIILPIHIHFSTVCRNQSSQQLFGILYLTWNRKIT